MGALANRLPMIIVAQLIGVPDTDVNQLVKWGYATTQLLDGLVSEDQLVASGHAVMELAGYITKRLRQAEADPQDTLLSSGHRLHIGGAGQGYRPVDDGRPVRGRW